MVTINTSDDLLRLLKENPEWKEAVRREILSEQLLNLPARFDQFVEEQQGFNARVDGFNARVDGFIERTDRAIERLRRDTSTMREVHARDETARDAEGIAHDMGFRMTRTLTLGDLLSIVVNSDTAGIETGDLRSFRNADLVIEAIDNDGEFHYIAVEISYTADERDTNRAIRNAEFLTRFTGYSAHPAVASIRNVNEIQDIIANGQVYWHQLEDREPRWDQ